MGLYNFQERFVPLILSGEKCHTIRAPRKGPEDAPGNTMHLYAGLRQKGARLLGRFECVRVEEIFISRHQVTIDGVRLDPEECDLLAWRDGFRYGAPPERAKNPEACFFLMMQHWSGRLPFRGHIFHWRYDEKRLATK